MHIMVEKMKHVQTEIPGDLYVRLLGMARASGITLKQQLREALIDFVDRKGRGAAEDSLLSLVASLHTEEGNWSERKDWRP